MPESAEKPAQKSCGGCTMCCKVLGIEELDKPEGSWCPHCAPGRGCTIYAQRPGECRTFACGWLLDPSLPDEWRPDRAKFVIFPHRGPQHLAVHLDPGSPDAWRREPYVSMLRQRAGISIRNGGNVLVVLKGKATLLLPKGELYLGDVKDGDTVVAKEVTGPNGTTFEASVIRAGTPSSQPA